MFCGTEWKKWSKTCLPALRECTIHTLHMKISRYMKEFINVAVLRFDFIFWAKSTFKFFEKTPPQNFEEQNECMTSLNRREKAAESNIEWKKKKALEFLWRNSVRESSNLTVPNKHHALPFPYEKKGSDFRTLATNMYSEAPWTQVNFKGIKEWKGLKSLAERNSTNQPNITCKWFAWYLFYRDVIFKNLLHSDTSVLSSHTWIKT